MEKVKLLSRYPVFLRANSIATKHILRRILYMHRRISCDAPSTTFLTGLCACKGKFPLMIGTTAGVPRGWKVFKKKNTKKI